MDSGASAAVGIHDAGRPPEVNASFERVGRPRRVHAPADGPWAAAVGVHDVNLCEIVAICGPTKASFVPSGDQGGAGKNMHVSKLGERRLLLPSAFITKISASELKCGTGTLLINAICSPFGDQAGLKSSWSGSQPHPGGGSRRTSNFGEGQLCPTAAVSSFKML